MVFRFCGVLFMPQNSFSSSRIVWQSHFQLKRESQVAASPRATPNLCKALEPCSTTWNLLAGLLLPRSIL